MDTMDRVLGAIARVESNSGVNNYPRFERSFAPKGMSWTIQGHVITGTGTNFTLVAQPRWAKWGLASACSFGPWQILYHTAADRGFTGAPWELWDQSRPWVEKELRRQFAKGADTIRKIADAWNSGSFTDANVPGDYVAAVTKAFKALGGDPDAPLAL